MKKHLCALACAFIACAAWAQPKVAVLDSMIGKDMDPAMSALVTDKVSESLVNSNKFKVLDRDNVDSVLKEREFQLSDMVSDKDAAAAGKYLGADYVVVVRVQRIDETYYVSGKMIAVETGVIARQASAQDEGKASVVTDLAAAVGETLSGKQGAAAKAVELKKVAVDQKLSPKRPGWPIFFNIIPSFGVGSFIEGDVWGGLVCLGGEILGGSLASSSNETVKTIGSATAVLTFVYGIIRPINFANDWNREHGLSSVEVLPVAVASANASGDAVIAPGAVVKLSY